MSPTRLRRLRVTSGMHEDETPAFRAPTASPASPPTTWPPAPLLADKWRAAGFITGDAQPRVVSKFWLPTATWATTIFFFQPPQQSRLRGRPRRVQSQRRLRRPPLSREGARLDGAPAPHAPLARDRPSLPQPPRPPRQRRDRAARCPSPRCASPTELSRHPRRARLRPASTAAGLCNGGGATGGCALRLGGGRAPASPVVLAAALALAFALRQKARVSALAIACRGLVKRYGDVLAVDGLDLEVRARRVLRPARPQRRGQDHHHRDPRRPARRRPRAT